MMDNKAEHQDDHQEGINQARSAIAENNIVSIELGSAMARIHARGKFSDADARDFVPTPESTYLYVDTPLYDGPLDLLLHLIRKHSMDIFDIPIFLITKKYLEALEEMDALNLDIAGEFLMMAATLLEIKSKMLLPKEERLEETDEESGEDPRAALVKKLLLYKSFTVAAQEMVQGPMAGRDFFVRPIIVDETPDAFEVDMPFSEIVLEPILIYELLESFNKMLKKAEVVNVHTITRDRISVSARLHELLDFCHVRSQFTFFDALKFFPIYEKADVIVTFLALLEMSRLKLLRIKIDQEYGLNLNIVKENFYAKQKEILNNIEQTKLGVSYE